MFVFNKICKRIDIKNELEHWKKALCYIVIHFNLFFSRLTATASRLVMMGCCNIPINHNSGQNIIMTITDDSGLTLHIARLQVRSGATIIMLPGSAHWTFT